MYSPADTCCVMTPAAMHAASRASIAAETLAHTNIMTDGKHEKRGNTVAFATSHGQPSLCCHSDPYLTSQSPLGWAWKDP